jgi:hypothetical protein
MLENLKICIQKYSKQYEDELNNIKQYSLTNPAYYKKLRAAFNKSKKWKPGSTIRIKFLDTPPEDIKRTEYFDYEDCDPLQEVVQNMDIISAIKLIVKERFKQSYLNLKLNFVEPTQEAEIRISFKDSTSCNSYVGTDCLTFYKYDQDIKTMNFGWFDVSAVLHEFGHALGMIHEHQNPNENQIQWNEEAVYEWAKRTQSWDKKTTYHNIIQQYNIDSINGSVYDPESIMLYFYPASLTLNNKGTEENKILSFGDVIYLADVYDDKPINQPIIDINNYIVHEYIILIIAVILIIVQIAILLLLIKMIRLLITYGSNYFNKASTVKISSIKQ